MGGALVMLAVAAAIVVVYVVESLDWECRGKCGRCVPSTLPSTYNATAYLPKSAATSSSLQKTIGSSLLFLLFYFVISFLLYE
jgi:hypothetical protein